MTALPRHSAPRVISPRSRACGGELLSEPAASTHGGGVLTVVRGRVPDLARDPADRGGRVPRRARPISHPDAGEFTGRLRTSLSHKALHQLTKLGGFAFPTRGLWTWLLHEPIIWAAGYSTRTGKLKLRHYRLLISLPQKQQGPKITLTMAPPRPPQLAASISNKRAMSLSGTERTSRVVRSLWGGKQTSPERDEIDANDPTATSTSILCRSSEAGFSPYQSTRLSHYDALS